jgi:hypothetical protein
MQQYLAALAGCGPMRAGEALGLDIRSIYEDFRTLEVVQKTKARRASGPYENEKRGFPGMGGWSICPSLWPRCCVTILKCGRMVDDFVAAEAINISKS